jgi:predicted dehydrogenase
MSAPLRFAIIGYGHIGTRHAHHIQQHPDAQWVGVCDIDAQRRNQAEQAGIPAYETLEELMAAQHPDVVSVCTPNYLHAPHSINALQHGAHVLCEKPMALSTAECDAMMAAAEKAQRTIFVVKQNRYNEPVQQVKQLIEQNRLGKLYWIGINCFWNRNEAYYKQSAWRGQKATDGGALFTQFSHFVDILYYLFGDIQAQGCGLLRNAHHPYNDTEDTGSIVTALLDGTPVNINFSTCAYQKNMEGAITLLAEKGTVKMGGQYLNTIEYQCLEGEALPHIPMQLKANDYGLYQGSMSNHDQVIDNVVKTLRGQAHAMTNARDGRTVVSMIEKLYAMANYA